MKLKKSLLSLILTAELSLSSLISGCSNNSKWSKIQNNPPNSLAKIQKYLYEEICYKEEKRDRWFSAKKTIESGVGDCEEIAILGSYFAEKIGYPAKLLFLIEKSSEAHIVTLLDEKNSKKTKYGAIEKADLFYPIYNSIDELICDINKLYGRDYFYYTILDLDSLNKNWITTNKNLISSNKLQTLNLTPITSSKKPINKQDSKFEGYKIGRSLILLK